MPHSADSRRETIAWMRRNNAASLAELYQGAVELMLRELPGRVRLVAHAVREIRNRLPDVLAPEQAGEHLNYQKRCEAIRDMWPPVSVLSGSATIRAPTASGTISIPIAAADQVQRLLDDDRAVEGKVRAAAMRLYKAAIRIRSGRTLTESELSAITPATLQWIKITEWFVERAHDSGRSDVDNDLREFADRFAVFEHALHSLIQEYYPATDALNDLLEEANS